MKRIVLSLALLLLACIAQAAVYPITKYGARRGKMATEAIQKALDAAEAAGGGTVVVPKGTWMTGTIWLRSHVELRLEKGAVLKGSVHKEDYNANDAFPENFWANPEEWSGAHLVIAYRVEDAAITGEGIIDGSGPAFFGECDEDSRFPWYKYGLKLHPIDRSWFRPGPMVAFFLSKNLRMAGVTLKDTPCWTVHVRACEDIDIRNVTIDADRTIANSDGFSIDCTRNVTIDGCTIRTGDDGFAIRACYRYKCLADDYPCENIRITNCDVWSCCYAVRIGIGTGIVRNVEIENCRFHESSFGIGFCPAWTPGQRGVYIDDILVRGCDVLECARPVESDALADDWRIRNVTFEDCRFESLMPISFTSSGSKRPENITFRNCTRKHLNALRVRHHMGWGGEQRSRKFIDGDDVENLKIENCFPAEGEGMLVLTFDDRHFTDWIQAMPLFEKYDAHATFFFSGPVDNEAVGVMKRLSEAGHSIGLHGFNHAKADEEVATKGGALFYKEEIEPQKYACQVAYVPITSYSYPYCRHNGETDALFKQWGFSHVRGGQVSPDDAAVLAVSASPMPLSLDSAFAGEDYGTDIEKILSLVRQAAAQKKVFVLSSHGISPDAKGIDMKTEWLEKILATAKECGLRAVGFDELP